MKKSSVQEHWESVLAQLKTNEMLMGNKLWRLENLYLITTKDGKKKSLKLNRAQKDYMANRKKKNILVKSRQLGFTTLITLNNLDDMLFKPNTDALAIAHIKEGMSDIFDKKVRFAVNNMHPEIKSIWKFKQNSTTKLQVISGEDSSSSFSVSLSGRSGTYQKVHVSEYAKLCATFPQRAEEVITGTFPAVPLDGEIDIESTAEGAQGSFYDLYMEAQNSLKYFNDSLAKVQFFPHFYNWTWDDMELDRIHEVIPIEKMEKGDIDWGLYQAEHGLTDKEITYYYMRWVSLKKNTDRLHQEYPTTWEEAFIASGTPYFPARRIADQMLKANDGVGYDVIGEKIEEIWNGPLQIWKKPEAKGVYVIGGDTAEGLSHGDYSVLSVVDVVTKDIVAIYRNQIEPFEFTSIAFRLAKYYNNAHLAIEVNKDGLWVNDQLQRMGYQNLYFREFIDDITKATNKYFGWKTDKKSRDVMLTELKTHFIKNEMLRPWLLREMMTFVRNSRGKPEAISGKHDDVIMATAIAYEVLKQKFHDYQQPTQSTASYMETIFGKVV